MPLWREEQQRPECTHSNTNTQNGLRHHPNPCMESLTIHNLHGNTMHWQWVVPSHAASSQTRNVTTGQRDLLRCKLLPEFPDLALPTLALWNRALPTLGPQDSSTSRTSAPNPNIPRDSAPDHEWCVQGRGTSEPLTAQPSGPWQLWAYCDLETPTQWLTQLQSQLLLCCTWTVSQVPTQPQGWWPGTQSGICPGSWTTLTVPARDTWPSVFPVPRIAPMVLARNPNQVPCWALGPGWHGKPKVTMKHPGLDTGVLQRIAGQRALWLQREFHTSSQPTLSTCIRQLRDPNHGGREYNWEQRH